MTVETGWTDGSVVVPAISAPSSVACLRSLGSRGVHTIAVSDDEHAAAFRSKYCDETVLIPSPHDDLVEYKEALRSLAMRPDVLTILPVREEDVYVLSNYREEFSDHVTPLWPTLGRLAGVQDRVRLFETADAVGIAAPETRLLGEIDDWDREWIVKSRYSILTEEYIEEYGPKDCVSPPTTRYLPAGSKPDTEAIRREMGHDPLIQEYVPTGEEYAFFALYDHGEALSTFQHRQIRGYSYAGGASALRESIHIPELESAGRALLDQLEWHGVAMVEFLRDGATGEFKLMEINPRFWSSLPFSVRASADFPYDCWLLANGREAAIDPEYEVGMAGHLLRGELLYLYTILTEDVDLVDKPPFRAAVRAVARSLVEHPEFDYLRLDDPRPFVRDALNTLGEARGQDRHR